MLHKFKMNASNESELCCCRSVVKWTSETETYGSSFSKGETFATTHHAALF
jgi:hypothetical protein